MDNKLRKEVRMLKAYAALSTLLFAVLIVVAARSPSKVTFDEIDAHRINIREKDGTLRLAISNRDQFPGGTMAGVEMKSREGKRGTAGLIFFNDEGDEVGGLAYAGKTVSGKTTAEGTIRFDHYRQNEAIGITYDRNGDESSSGLQVWDVPDTPFTAEVIRQGDSIPLMKNGPEKTAVLKKLRAIGHLTERVFVGRTPQDAAAVLLMDTSGKPRIRMMVDSSNVATLEFLDENGKVVSRFPNTSPKQ